MHSQVLNVTVDPKNKAEVDELIESWARGPGKNLPGCEKIAVAHELGGLNRVTVFVYFKDQHALDSFSKNQDSLDFFAKAKSLVKGSPSYYEASIQEITLT
jgi:quinol monooxygenase YgiN